MRQLIDEEEVWFEAEPGQGLTRDKATVLAHIANGFRLEQIARLIGKTPRVTKYHLESAREALGASTQAAAVARAQTLGVVRAVWEQPAKTASALFLGIALQGLGWQLATGQMDRPMARRVAKQSNRRNEIETGWTA